MRTPILSVVLVAAALLVAPSVSRAQGPSVAVVTAVEGQVSTSPGERPVRAFDWIAADTRIATGPRSSVVLTFANGTRVKIKARSKAVVLTTQVQTLAGGADGMLVVPAFPIRGEGHDGATAEATAAEEAAHRAFVNAIGTTADPDLLLLAAAVDLQWGHTADAGTFLQRARAVKAPAKLVEVLERRIGR